MIETIFKRLKVLHPLWVNGDNDYKKRLENGLEKDLKTLEKLGVERNFSEAILFFGKDFVDSLTEEDKLIRNTELIFGSKSKKMSSDSVKAAEIAKKREVSIYEIVKKNGRVGIRPINSVSTSKKEVSSQGNLDLKNT